MRSEEAHLEGSELVDVAGDLGAVGLVEAEEEVLELAPEELRAVLELALDALPHDRLDAGRVQRRLVVAAEGGLRW